MLVLAIESSTSSTKSFLYDPEKSIVASARENYGPLHRSGKTDAEGVFSLTMKTAEKIARGQPVGAIALCGTWHSICALGADMRPVTHTYSWDFMETSAETERIRKDTTLTDAFYRRTGCMPHNTYPCHTIGYLKKQGLDIQNCKFITQGAYHFYRLTGCFRESRCTQSGSGLINLDTREYDDFVLDYYGLRRDQLGALADYRDTAPLSAEGAALLGLRPGIPVVPAHPDGALNQLGSYAGRPGIMTMSVGTSGALRLTAEQPVLPENRGLWCYLGVEGVISGAAVAGACNCIDWFRKGLLKERFSYAELEGDGPMAADTPVFLPFLFGERCPGWRADRRSGFVGVDSAHSLPDLYRAVQMGVLMNLRQCYDILCRENGAPREILLSGGILNSTRWIQMAADIFEREMLVVDCPDASAMGAVALALYTAGGLESINDFRGEYDKAVLYQPDMDKAAFYRRQFARYLDAYAGSL